MDFDYNEKTKYLLGQLRDPHDQHARRCSPYCLTAVQAMWSYLY